MASPAPRPLYTDTPLSLLSTPAFETKKNDSFTMEASHMTLSHNSIIRGYNSIYQQAPRITASSDEADFIGYCIAWLHFVEKHHDYEEVHLFPAIEEAVAQKGAMSGLVEEHKAFDDGLKRFGAYLTEVQQRTSDFLSSRLLEIMDSFSAPLYSHLVSEPQALVALSRFSTVEAPIDIEAIALEQGKKQVSLGFAFNVMPMFLLNMEDVEFEDGMWKSFPPIPGPAKWALKNVVPMWQRKWWRFASCDGEGRRKRLAV